MGGRGVNAARPQKRGTNEISHTNFVRSEITRVPFRRLSSSLLALQMPFSTSITENKTSVLKRQKCDTNEGSFVRDSDRDTALTRSFVSLSRDFNNSPRRARSPYIRRAKLYRIIESSPEKRGNIFAVAWRFIYQAVLRKSHYATYHRNTRGSGMYGDFLRPERGRELPFAPVETQFSFFLFFITDATNTRQDML